MPLAETPWVDRNLKTVLPKLHGRVPDSWLPRMITERREEVRRMPPGVWPWEAHYVPVTTFETKTFKSPVVEEYGCGHYGCVMPTREPNLVMKITSDVSEARFVARAMQLEPTPGIVEYKQIFGLETTHKNRPLFVLWRTEATEVGRWSEARMREMVNNRDLEYEHARRVDGQAKSQLGAFLRWGQEVRKYMHPKLRAADGTERHKLLARAWQLYEYSEPAQEMQVATVARLKGIDRVAVALRTCLYISQEMMGNESLYKVGEALGHYLENGLCLADVHANNIGLDHEGIPIITDPGHAVEFHPRWTDAPQIPKL